MPVGEAMTFKVVLDQLSRELQQWISDYLGGRCTRTQLADWASSRLRVNCHKFVYKNLYNSPFSCA
jgi:hypothetical protein